MLKTFSKNGTLHYMDSDGEESVFIHRYMEGDVDIAPWPLTEEWEGRLRTELFGMRECGELEGNSIILPDGSVFDIA